MRRPGNPYPEQGQAGAKPAETQAGGGSSPRAPGRPLEPTGNSWPREMLIQEGAVPKGIPSIRTERGLQASPGLASVFANFDHKKMIR